MRPQSIRRSAVLPWAGSATVTALMPRLNRQITVRVSEDLYALIVKDSVDNGRTDGQTIRFRLELAYGLRPTE